MSTLALVIDDDEDIVQDVADRLESLGHASHCATCQATAREQLAAGEYDYILLDLQIPVKYGRISRITNGQNLLREIRKSSAHAATPIIVMTAHGLDSPQLAVESMRDDGADDFVTKPFPDTGNSTLERAIRDALKRGRRSAAAGSTTPEPSTDVRPFTGGELAFLPTSIELCGVRIAGTGDAAAAVLEALREVTDRGRYRAYSGADLAHRTGLRNANAVSSTVATLRGKIAYRLLQEAGLQAGRFDVIRSGGIGYRLADWITVRNGHDGDGTIAQSSGATPPPTPEPERPELNKRQEWILEQLESGIEIRLGDVMTRFSCGKSTAKRDLATLRERGIIQFVGATRTGHYRLAARR